MSYMGPLEKHYPESRYGGFSDVDGTVTFYTRVSALLKPNYVALDVGCGRGKNSDDKAPFRRELTNLKKRCAKVIGIDVDPVGVHNPFIDEFKIIDSDRWPIEDDSINIIVSDFVLEHVPDPNKYFSEVRRVLTSGGYFCARTTNRFGYVAIISKLVPERMHNRVLKTAQPNRKEADTFPAYYRANDIRRLRSLMTSHSLSCHVYGYDAEPNYLQFSDLLYRIGAKVNILTPSFLKNSIFIFAQKV